MFAIRSFTRFYFALTKRANNDIRVVGCLPLNSKHNVSHCFSTLREKQWHLCFKSEHTLQGVSFCADCNRNSNPNTTSEISVRSLNVNPFNADRIRNLSTKRQNGTKTHLSNQEGINKTAVICLQMNRERFAMLSLRMIWGNIKLCCFFLMRRVYNRIGQLSSTLNRVSKYLFVSFNLE